MPELLANGQLGLMVQILLFRPQSCMIGSSLCRIANLPVPDNVLEHRMAKPVQTRKSGPSGISLVDSQLLHIVSRGGIKEPKPASSRVLATHPHRRTLTTKVIGAFPDGKSALMLVAARLRHVSATHWNLRKYMNFGLLKEPGPLPTESAKDY